MNPSIANYFDTSSDFKSFLFIDVKFKLLCMLLYFGVCDFFNLKRGIAMIKVQVYCINSYKKPLTISCDCCYKNHINSF